MKKTSIFVAGAFLLTGLLSNISRADSITLRDGRHLQGKFAGGTQGVIAFSVAGATQYYDVSSILVMTFDAEGNETTPSAGQEPSIIPDASPLRPQKLDKAPHSSRSKVINSEGQKKRPVRLIRTAQRSE